MMQAGDAVVLDDEAKALAEGWVRVAPGGNARSAGIIASSCCDTWRAGQMVPHSEAESDKRYEVVFEELALRVGRGRAILTIAGGAWSVVGLSSTEIYYRAGALSSVG
jgi:hypothetical protein